MRSLSVRMRSVAWVLGIAACLATLVPAGTSARSVEPRLLGQQVWGWVVARHPSAADYTPAVKDRGNSSGGTNTVQRVGEGQYRVTFEGLGTPGGALIHISPLGTAARLCVIDDWGVSVSEDDYIVLVDCRNRHGSHADTAFVVNLLILFLVQDDLGYVVANEPGTTDYLPAIQYNSAQETNSVHRLGTGRWRVTFPGIGGSSGKGSVQVTASGVEGTVCRVTSWEAGLVANVACRDHDGSLVDTSFHLGYMKGRGLKFPGDPNVAFLLADRPTTSSYTPTSGYRFSTAGIAPRVQRTSRGVYFVKLEGQPLGGSAQVSAYGGGSKRCVIASIRTSDKPQRIGVRCFTADGSALADAKFTLTYAR